MNDYDINISTQNYILKTWLSYPKIQFNEQSKDKYLDMKWRLTWSFLEEMNYWY